MSECGKTFSVKKGLCRAARRVISIYKPAIEDEYAENMYQRSELDWLIDHDPAAYAELVLHGDVAEFLKTATDYRCLE